MFLTRYRDLMAMGRLPVNIYMNGALPCASHGDEEFPGPGSAGPSSVKMGHSEPAMDSTLLGLSRLVWRGALRRYTSVSS